jgi:colanic acid/amylovoran biosynthesis glycosyltransferase
VNAMTRDRHASERESTRLNVVYVIGTYPVPTTTFIDREIQALRGMGVRVQVVSIRPPPRALSSEQAALGADVQYVLPAGVGGLMWSHVTFLLSRPVPYAGTLKYLITRRHPNLRARLRTVGHFGVGVHAARLIRERCPSDHVHAHFVDRAAVVALVVGRLLRRPFSATAHANDIYVDPVLLPEKMAGAKFIATCTRYNASHLRSVSEDASGRGVRCVYHGLDLQEYQPSSTRPRHRPLLLSVGQLKEKKGFRYLLDACRMLVDRGVEFDCQIVGEGPQRLELEARLDELSLRDRVSLVGPLPHAGVIAKYREATIFVLPCVTASDGDRDGIPNVILEAMAMQLPVVSTRHSGIPEAVQDQVNGLLVPPADPSALAEALARLLEDADLRERFGRNGRRRIVDVFDAEVNAQTLLEEFVA